MTEATHAVGGSGAPWCTQTPLFGTRLAQDWWRPRPPVHRILVSTGAYGACQLVNSEVSPPHPGSGSGMDTSRQSLTPRERSQHPKTPAESQKYQRRIHHEHLLSSSRCYGLTTFIPFVGRTPWQQGTGLPVSGHRHEHTCSHPRSDPQSQAPSSGSTGQRDQPTRSDLLIRIVLFIRYSKRPMGRFSMACAGNFHAIGAAPERGRPAGHRPQSPAVGCPAAEERLWRPRA